MSQITLCEDTFEPSTWETYDNVVDVRDFLFKHFEGTWPSGTHIYLDHVAKNADITPYDNAGVERLGKLTGHFFVVVYPEGIELILIIVALAVSAVAIGLSFLLRPHPPSNQQNNSANNQLANRQNTARPNSRIPDIYGQLWATFDLIAVPYFDFVDNVEYEHCYMCVGRGQYQFESIGGVLQLRDDITPITNIDRASAKIFGPNTNPNNGTSPSLTIGPAFSEEVVNLQVFAGVNGQVLKAPNLNAWGPVANPPSNTLRFRNGGFIENSTGVDWRDGFQVNDILNIGGYAPGDGTAIDSAGIQPPVDLSGSYIISSVTATQIGLVAPSTINPNWSALAAFGGGVSAYGSDNMMANNTFWVSSPLEFFVSHPDVNEIWCNFVCPQGCYQVDSSSGKQTAVSVTVALGITPCDATGTPTGGEGLYTATLTGSSFDRQPKGISLKATGFTPGVGGVLIRARRTTNTNLAGTVTVADEIQWRDCYMVTGICAISDEDFGNVTTIQTVLRATPKALSIKNRKFNALVTRKVPVPSGSALAASTNAADIICAMALDPYIGNMQASDIDVAEIYAVAGPGGAIQTYFSAVADPTLLTQFCYTFDDPTVSFEESLAEIASSIFCVAYRRGGLLSLSFEKQTANSTLLFNHRNKVPKSETRTVTFGTSTNNDGINLDYVEPNAPNYPNLDTTVTLYFPPDVSAVNPKKVTAIGIRNIQQAMVLGWRLYWKLMAQHTAVQFDATEEAALLVLQDRILVADNTRSDTQDGDVIDQSALLLTLSQNVVFVGGLTYSIFLQHPDETVENIPITAGPNPNQVVLGHAPTLPCIFDDTYFAKTTYMIVSSAFVSQNAFLVSEKTPKNGKIFELKAVNYDDSYYGHDLDLGVTVIGSLASPCGSIFSGGGGGGGLGGGGGAPSYVFVMAYEFDYYAITSRQLRGVNSSGIINTLVLTSSDSLYVTNGGFNSIQGMESDSLGNMYINDGPDNYRVKQAIYKIDRSLNVTRVAGTGVMLSGSGPFTFAGDGGSALAARLFGSGSVALDAAGNIYLGAQGAIRVVNMQSSTQVLLGVSVGAGCIAQVAGSYGNSSSTINGDGGSALSSFLQPQGGAGGQLDPAGNLYFPDNNGIRKIDTSGIISTIISPGSGYLYRLGHCDAAGNLFLCETYLNNRVRVKNMQSTTQTFFGVSIGPGAIATIAGLNGGSGFGSTGDGGPATAAKIQGAYHTTLDSSGNLYISCAGGQVRKVTPAGIISTVAGYLSGTYGATGDGGPATAATMFNVSSIAV